MARWRLHLVLLVVLLVIAALATWRISAYPPELRATLAWQRPLLGLRVLQVTAGVCALICGGLLLRDGLEGEAGDSGRRYNWLCPACGRIVEAERDICPFCGATRTGLPRSA